MSIPLYFCAPTETQALFLRRYLSGSTCPIHGYHDARNPYTRTDIRRDADGYIDVPDIVAPAHDHTGWPVTCDCGYTFAESDNWQLFAKTLYTRTDTNEEVTLDACPPGALWIATWLEGHYPSPDGQIVMCKTPGGDWCIDSTANNCTNPDDKVHNCWIRHGDPTDPQGTKTGVKFHVDKSGNTCSAGAGSIQCNDYHGFLHHGMLTQC